MTNNLKDAQGLAIGGYGKRRLKGWSPNRRARQAALIRGWQPWRRSTGPKTEAGKTRCAMNALKHGFKSRASIEEFQRVRYALRLAAHNIQIGRLFIRMRDAHPDLKPAYANLLSAARDRLRHLRAARAEKISNSIKRTIGSANSQTRPIAYERPMERPHGYGRPRATSHSGREGSLVLQSPKRVGRRLVTPEPRGGEGGMRSPP